MRGAAIVFAAIRIREGFLQLVESACSGTAERSGRPPQIPRRGAHPEVASEARQVARTGAAPAVDRLVRVAHSGDGDASDPPNSVESSAVCTTLVSWYSSSSTTG